MQIRTKLTLQFTLLVSGILLISFVAIYYFSYVNTKEDFFDRLRSKAEGTASLLLKVKEIDNELLKIIDGTNRDQIFNDNMIIFDEENRVIYTNLTPPTKPAISISNFWLDEIRRAGEIRYSDGDYEVVGLYYRYPYNRSVVLFAGQDLYGKANLANLRTVLFIIFMVVTAVVALAGWFFARRALAPITRVMNDLEGILPQNLGVRLKATNNRDEIGRLTGTFNKLLDRIENAFKMQKTFVANVSHELKNPLTKVNAQLEVVLLKEREAETYRQTIASVLEDVRELSILSDSLLELAKVSDDRRDLLTERVRIDELLLDLREKMTHSDCTIGINFADLPEDDSWLELQGNSGLLKTAFLNLIDNGCKFSSDQAVNITLATDRRSIQVDVSNRGVGITEEDQQNIFHPFFRSNKTAGVKGYGIGLSLTERIVRLHEGTIRLKSNSDGTVFTVIFPRR
jgi:signal transduction histidine kinase